MITTGGGDFDATRLQEGNSQDIGYSRINSGGGGAPEPPRPRSGTGNCMYPMLFSFRI